ncbi:uncharacterized protein LOC119933428 [Tachyglossus aculeatus]|uniref:uncharacterized protein LOC119933428 n=1 Tax=Tachyglossus aculeatus TaxID=9261 RepID=UPI0018F2A3E2|nr:uncharacterized protein LOC119933428 [Tachyglossus aculeatus]XP_038608885.1 uncharacterized protein LOC119933428 [Tachyglossus aculeatus]
MCPELRIYAALQELDEGQLRRFKLLLHQAGGRPPGWGVLQAATREDLPGLLAAHYAGRALAVVAQVLRQMPALHLLDQLHGTAPGDATRGPQDTPGETSDPPLTTDAGERVVSQRQLMRLARKLGRQWREVGVEFLGLRRHQLDGVEEDHGTVGTRVFAMLMLWRNREGPAATASRLLRLLSQDDSPVDPEALAELLDRP